MLKKNFKIVSPSGGLSGSEVNDLYKIYTSMDGKHKKFKGSKEEYITAVSGLIKKFVDSSMGDSTHLMGGVKLRDILKRNKLEKELPKLKKKIEELKTEREKLFSTAGQEGVKERNKLLRDIRQLNSDIITVNKDITETNEKIATRDATKQAKARAVVESEFKEGEKIFEEGKRYTEGTLPRQDESGVYYESDLQHVINPFYISPEGGDVPSFVGTTSQKYQQLVEYTAKYYAFVKTILTSALPENTKAGHAPTPVNKTMLRNFLIAAPFQHLTELSPRGRSQREEFASHLTSLGRKTLVGTTKMGWTETEEGSYRSEQFVYWGYLAQSEMNPIKRTCKQFELLGKIFSLETANERVDYNFKLYTGESKGRKTLDGVFQQKGTKRPQIDLDKIISIIAHAATIDSDGKVHYNYPNALFTLYKSDMQLVKYNETKPERLEIRPLMTTKVPFEVILRLNLLKVIEAAKDVTIPSLARGPAIVDGAPSKKELALQEQDPEYTPKAKKRLTYTVPPRQVGTVKQQVPLLEELDTIIRDYHKLRNEGMPKFAGKLLSFEKNKERISIVATKLLNNFFIESSFRDVAPSLEATKKKYDTAKQAATSEAAREIFENKATYFNSKFMPTGITELKLVFLSPKNFKKFLKDNNTTATSVFKTGITPDTLKEIIGKYVEGYLVEQNIAVPESKRTLFSAGDLYTGKLVDLDISQPYIAKHIEVVGYSKSLFTVGGRLQQATALNYSKFFVKGPTEDKAWLERYQDFTGDTPDNYTFKKIDIDAPIIESHGEFEPIEDVKVSKKKSLRKDYDMLDDEQKLTVINKMVQYIEDNDDSSYSKLPSSYEQNKLLNFFITRYPHDTEKFISDIFGGPDEEEDIIDNDYYFSEDEVDESTGVEEAKTAVDDDEEGGGKPKLKANGKPKAKPPKAYHKKVIKYY